MGLQLIICVETNKKSKTDRIYISQTIGRFYQLDQAHQKLSFVYMDGKGKYASSSVKRAINTLTKEYRATSSNNNSIVIYCFDCDDYDIKQEDNDFLKTAESYCKKNGFRFVWFCKDIEEVYLGRSIEDNSKSREATSFAAKGIIKQVDLERLKKSIYQKGCSNLCLILDEYLKKRD